MLRRQLHEGAPEVEATVELKRRLLAEISTERVT
jgi:hypothetical protein